MKRVIRRQIAKNIRKGQIIAIDGAFHRIRAVDHFPEYGNGGQTMVLYGGNKNGYIKGKAFDFRSSVLRQRQA